MWSPSRSIATLNSASPIITSSSSVLVRVVLLLVRMELLSDPEPALLVDPYPFSYQVGTVAGAVDVAVDAVATSSLANQQL